ncbi:uncharacterized protein LOC127710283 isoform X2 [Mytilus californianus]|uniref:uncharacterized protein LOC127710283 isoform X2 n=1 Tax=Mytilus californianus TaxID=6549 RepID=UPI0022454F4D|nr:uncharacterized protein LOC127710283 isoform X2 [Mytilus californianus]
MVNREELIAIVGGSLAGLVVLMVTIAICIYCCCGRKKESKKNNRRFQPLQSGNDSSKHSTLNGVDPRVDPRSTENRLPKVGSNGLWMGGAPSMYAVPPPNNYHYGDRDRDRERDRHGKRSSSLQRTTSEERLHQSRGHPVYTSGNMHLYHSNPYNYYEPYALPRSNSYLNMYGGYPPYPSNSSRDSRAMLVEYPEGHEYIYDPYRDTTDDRRRGKKVKRTHSDLTGTKRKRKEKRRGSPMENRRNRSIERLDRPSGSDRATSADVHRQQKQPYILQTKEQRPPKEISEQTATIDIHDTELSECATDSAKIRAIQGRTSDPEPISKKWPVNDELKLDLPSDINDDGTDDIEVKRYQYVGNYPNKIESHPNKPTENKTGGYTNSAYIENERRDGGHVHKRLEKRESNTDGKQVSAAFDFLNNYVSDEEEPVFADSRRQSPLPFDT